jgi:hypothetical protein
MWKRVGLGQLMRFVQAGRGNAAMTYVNNPDYYRLREASSRRLANQALDPAIRAIHLEMAQRYAAIVTLGDEIATRTLQRPFDPDALSSAPDGAPAPTGL